MRFDGGLQRQKAGLKEGDIIVGFGDAIIRGPVGLTERLRKAKAGDQARVTVLRDGKRETVTVKLGERTAISVFKMTPGEEGEIELAVPDTKILERDLEDVRKSIPELRDKEKKLRLLLGAPGGSHVLRFLAEKPRLGVELLDVTADLREYFGGKKETGVLVGKVLTGSPAERAGLRAGDLIVAVDGEAVESSGDLMIIL